MSSLPTTTSGHSSLYSAQTLPRTTQIHPTLFSSSPKFFSCRSTSYSGVSFCFSNTLLSRPLLFTVKASSGVGSEASKQESDKSEEQEEEPYEEYEVEIEQPFGIKFAKGRDGGTYIDAIAPGGSADKAGVFNVGDKVLATRCALHVFVFSSFCNFLYLENYIENLGVGFKVSCLRDFIGGLIFILGWFMDVEMMSFKVLLRSKLVLFVFVS